MADLENYKLNEKLFDYLTKCPKIIKDSLDQNNMRYQHIKILRVSINEDDWIFEVEVETHISSGRVLGTFPIPKNFLRRMKLEKLKTLR
jgi:hypothetical protein